MFVFLPALKNCLFRNNIQVINENPQDMLSTGNTSVVQRSSNESYSCVYGLSKVTGALFLEIYATFELGQMGHILVNDL